MRVRFTSAKESACALIRLITCILISGSLLSAADAQAMVFSNDAHASTVAVAEEQGFDGVGRIACVDQHSQAITYVATGSVLGGTDTVVTAAHTLFPHTAPGQPKTILNPRYCMFILYGPDERVRGYAHVRYALSPWSETRFRYDSSYDVAVLKLDRPMPVANIPAVRLFRGSAMPLVQLAALHTGVDEPHRIRVTQGPLRAFPGEQLRNAAASTKITIASHMFSTSADSTPGSSGGMYYDAQTHAAIGLHIGRICDLTQARTAYDPASCFNYGLRFNAEIIALIDMVAHDNPAPAQLVIANNDADHVALAPSGKRAG